MSEHPISIEMLEEGHLLLLGTTGAGKTYQQRGFLERLRFNGRRVGAVDKLGNHWGLTLSADGKGAGLDFIIFGGKRGHVPMTPLDGERIGRLFVERNIPAIFDVSQWKADEQLDWMEGFADAVFLHNEGPLHLGLDEAQSWVPQGGGGDAFNSVRRLAEQGRGNGIRLMMAAQRLSRIDKSCAGMAAVVVAMRQTGTADRKAMRDLLAADADQMAMIERELPGLPTGSGFVWDPLQGSLVRHAFPANLTFDSSRTPRHGDTPPASIAVSSDLVEELRQALAPPVKSSVADDYPDDVIPADPMTAFEKGGAIGAMLVERDDRIADLELANRMLEATAETLAAERDQLDIAISLIVRIAGMARRAELTKDLHHRLTGVKQAQTAVTAPGGSEPPAAVEVAPPARDVRIPPSHAGGASDRDLRSLAVLAAIYPAGLSEAAWAGRAGRARKGGAWASQRKRYADAGLIEKRDGRWFATAAGVETAAGEVPTLPAPGAELVNWWADRLGPAGKLLRHLYGMHGLSRGELAAAVNMTATGGAFSGAVAELKRNELIEERGKRLFVAPALTGEEA
ncbi:MULTISPECIES: hypothetical protein [unclassified Sphingobium]|uniref:hypothetical protein n=1 Tax=unclassified Sphingobium TaxID=2611147 RepID=UPI0035A5D402